MNQLPRELAQYIVQQDYSLYTAMDQASWRYILRVNRVFFAHNAYPKYFEGLKNTGIPIDEIPRIEDMDRCLQKFGWRAVAVSGFIPPSVFLEMQAMGILPIACDMRTLEHLAYTPAPDIVHEAAGHAPFIVDSEYSDYLRKYAEVARKAIFTLEDKEVYEAIRHLSIVKEEPSSTENDIAQAQLRLDQAIAANTYVSEATLLGRMAWWSTEYGLIQEGDRPLIFGAGLLSSAGESFKCLSEEVRKIPFTLDCVHQTFDITRPQPQLYVTPDFPTLTRVLEEFSAQMAHRRGGYEGLAKAMQARTVTTTVLDSGLQISGRLQHVWFDHDHGPYFIRYEGPTQLALEDRELEGHSAQTHAHGFSSPIGDVAGLHKSAAQLTTSELEKMGFAKGQKGCLEFASGMVLTGIFLGAIQYRGHNVVLSFEDCTVRFRDQVLYKPEWGAFDLACGEKVSSVFGGASDRLAYFNVVTSEKEHSAGHPKTNLTTTNRTLNEMYAQVRHIRTQNLEIQRLGELETLAENVAQQFPHDWLLTLEILELTRRHNPDLALRLQTRLDQLATRCPDTASLIRRGLEALG